jgi:hypothetical protein
MEILGMELFGRISGFDRDAATLGTGLQGSDP